MLITLAYRIPREHLDSVLGTVTAYPLTEEFEQAWGTLPGAETGNRPPYAALATGLIAATGQPVRLFGENDLAEKEHALGSRSLLLTSDVALDFRLRTAIRAWEGHLRGGTGSSVLAEILPSPEPARAFTAFIEDRPGRVPVAPNWVFRTAAWKIMRALAANPLDLDGRSFRLRVDTDGSLLLWDDLLVHAKNGHSMFGMGRITVRLVTRAGVGDPVLCFDAHLSRLAPAWYGRRTRNAWILRDGGAAPIVRLPVRACKDSDSGECRMSLNPAIAAILEACQLEEMTLPATLPAVPGSIRPQLAVSRFHTLGSGLGPRFMFFLHKHIEKQLDRLVPLRYEADRSIRLPKQVRKHPVGGLPTASVGPTGYDKVTLACVYRTPDARRRMLDEVKLLTGVTVSAEPDGSAVAINERLDVVALWRPELLDHETVNRASHLAEFATMASEPGRLVAVWAETEYHPDMDPPELDAKPHLRRLFGHLGIPTQFLATDPVPLPSGAVSRDNEQKKHITRAALRDLLRSAGVLDGRVPGALTHVSLPHRLTHPVLLVGIHARRQQTGKGEPILAMVMVALLLQPDDLVCSRMLVYSEKGEVWEPAPKGITGFSSGPIGSARFGRTGEKAVRTRNVVEARLSALAGEFPTVPMVIFADAPATRTIWPALQDVSLGTGPLPGDSLRARGHDVAVIRLNTRITEIGRPVTRRERANMPPDPNQPAAPGKKVYRLTDSSIRSWIFPGASLQTRAKGGNRGAQQTRWTLDVKKGGRRQLGDPWHAYTAKEIVIVESASWTPETLVTLTARLCEQAISWDDRTVLPVPLHLAVSADKDHPDYRASGSSEEEWDADESLLVETSSDFS